jgi:hypothetical protein
MASIATLFHNEEVLTHLREVGAYSSKEQLYIALAKRRYRLDFYIDRDRSGKCGLVPLDRLSHLAADSQNDSLGSP